MRPATRRVRFLLGGAAAVALLGLGSPAPSVSQGQTPAAEARPVDPGRFLGFAHSSAVLQERASRLAASKDTRPEVKEFAREMARFRGQQVERLRAVAQERGLGPPAEGEFEHRVVLENLEPLDHLALSRRYAEVQVQVLEQEIRGYEAASRGADEAMKRFFAEMLPELRHGSGPPTGCMTPLNPDRSGTAKGNTPPASLGGLPRGPVAAHGPGR